MTYDDRADDGFRDSPAFRDSFAYRESVAARKATDLGYAEEPAPRSTAYTPGTYPIGDYQSTD